MGITAISRDWGDSVSIVRIISTDTIATVVSTNYISNQQNNIDLANQGIFSWLPSDMVLVYARDGWIFASISSNFASLIVNFGTGVTPQNIQDQSFIYGIDTGVTNALAIAPVPAIAAYQNGQYFSVVASHSNSGASTINVNSLGAIPIVLNGGTALSGGEIVNGSIYQLQYLNGSFVLVNASGGGGGGGVTAAQVQQSIFNYSADTGTDGTAYVATLSPAPTSLTDGMLVILAPQFVNTITTPTLNVNGLGAANIVSAGQPVALGDIQGTQDGTGIDAVFQYASSFDEWTLLNPTSSIQAAFNSATGVFNTTTADMGGSANTYAANNPLYGNVLTIDNPSAIVTFTPENTNTGASTFQWSGMAAAPIVLTNGNPITAGMLQAGSVALLLYNMNLGNWQLANPATVI